MITMWIPAYTGPFAFSPLSTNFLFRINTAENLSPRSAEQLIRQPKVFSLKLSPLHDLRLSACRQRRVCVRLISESRDKADGQLDIIAQCTVRRPGSCRLQFLGVRVASPDKGPDVGTPLQGQVLFSLAHDSRSVLYSASQIRVTAS